MLFPNADQIRFFFDVNPPNYHLCKLSHHNHTILNFQCPHSADTVALSAGWQPTVSGRLSVCVTPHAFVLSVPSRRSYGSLFSRSEHLRPCCQLAGERTKKTRSLQYGHACFGLDHGRAECVRVALDVRGNCAEHRSCEGHDFLRVLRGQTLSVSCFSPLAVLRSLSNISLIPGSPAGFA